MKFEKLGGKLTSISLALEAGLFLLRLGKSVVGEVKGKKAKAPDAAATPNAEGDA